MDVVAWQFKLLCCLITISSITLSIPVADFFNFNTELPCDIVHGSITANDVFNTSCTEIIFPRAVNVTISYIIPVLLPFFDSTVVEVYVSSVYNITAMSACCLVGQH